MPPPPTPTTLLAAALGRPLGHLWTWDAVDFPSILSQVGGLPASISNLWGGSPEALAVATGNMVTPAGTPRLPRGWTLPIPKADNEGRGGDDLSDELQHSPRVAT